jgi:hypothetical protein
VASFAVQKIKIGFNLSETGTGLRAEIEDKHFIISKTL